MTGLLVCGLSVAGDGSRPAVGVEGPLAAQHGEREPVHAVADGDHGDQRRFAAGQQLVAVGDEIGVVQADATAEVDDGSAQLDRSFAANAGAGSGAAGGLVGDGTRPEAAVGTGRGRLRVAAAASR